MNIVRYTGKVMQEVNIGDILFAKELLTHEQIKVILDKKSDKLFGQKAISLGFISEKNLLPVLSEIYHIEIISLEFLYIPKDVLNLLSIRTAIECCAVPFFADSQVVKVALADPGNLVAVDKIRAELKTRKTIFYLAKESEILYLTQLMKNNLKEITQNPLLLLNKIIFDALEQKASDIHFETQQNHIRVRFRIDGILVESSLINQENWSRIKARLKLISNLDITENRKPQSGHTRIHLGGKTVDLRISTHPGIFGENLVLRIFDLSKGIQSLSELNFCYEDFCWLKKIISQPHGIFLIIGPTGAGKTTTLYSLLNEINSSNLNIMTLEDPVEYQIEGIRQLDIQEEGILSFADGIKSILRQDPDIILIGEIRDEATAAMALRASLTGRLVIATLHASSPYEVLRRLTDLGLTPSDFLPSLLGIFSQRLIRYKKNNNYRGRFPITEYVSFSEEIKLEILENSNCKFQLDKTFQESAQEALRKELTDASEIKRVMGNEFI